MSGSLRSRKQAPNIVKFPVRRTRVSGVFCRPLGITFPTLWCVKQTLTREHIKKLGMRPPRDFEPVVGYRHYVFTESDKCFPGVLERSVVRSL
jgi:hypothetical protein